MTVNVFNRGAELSLFVDHKSDVRDNDLPITTVDFPLIFESAFDVVTLKQVTNSEDS